MLILAEISRPMSRANRLGRGAIKTEFADSNSPSCGMKRGLFIGLIGPQEDNPCASMIRKFRTKLVWIEDWNGPCSVAGQREIADLISSQNSSKGDELMAKNKGRESGNSIVPLIAFDDVAFEKESFKLSWPVLANLREYVAYVKDVTGKETTPDAVVDKGMQRLFDADKGFRHWLQKKNSEGRSKMRPVKSEKPEKPSQDTKPTAANELSAKTQI
jgi:hypothetical protein